ncbi:MAG: hypothetical protein JXR69_04400 [Candidatus Delongbacteria bacterium]|nr:hypothetical protein [Candidatus Delongbacteria bacterium]
MKKMITTLTLLAFLATGVFAQTSAPADKGFKPGIGNPDCPQYEKFHENKDFGRKGFRKGGDFEGRGDGFGPRMIEMLELNDDQIEKMHKIKVEFDKKEIDLKATEKKLRIDKKEAMKDMDFSKARSITKEMSKTRTDLQILHIDEKEKMAMVLTKDQIAKMKKMHPMGNRDGKKGKWLKK